MHYAEFRTQRLMKAVCCVVDEDCTEIRLKPHADKESYDNNTKRLHCTELYIIARCRTKRIYAVLEEKQNNVLELIYAVLEEKQHSGINLCCFRRKTA